MEKPRILALDIGTKRTGIAVSDESRTIASPRSYVEANGKKDWLKKILVTIESEEAGEVLVGIPLNHHGEEGEDALRIRQYVTLLRDHTKLPVVEWDERFTTVQAERFLIEGDVKRKTRKEKVDKVAACILLQNYLDSLTWQTNNLQSFPE